MAHQHHFLLKEQSCNHILYAKWEETGVINGSSKKKERKFCDYLCSFMRRGEKRKSEEQEWGYWKPEKKEFILHYHNTLACIGIGYQESGGSLQGTKGESEDV